MAYIHEKIDLGIIGIINWSTSAGLSRTISVTAGYSKSLWLVGRRRLYYSDPHHYFAMLESALIPAVLLAIMPLNQRLPPLSWLTIFRTNFSWWLFGMNWFILINLFVRATWLDWGSMTWILVGLIVFLSKLAGLIATNYRS